MEGEGMHIAIVTGAGGGLGREFVRLLAAEETLDEIWIIARTREKLEALQGEITGVRIRPMPMDLTDRTAPERLADALEAASPDVRYLINNAGYAKFGAYDDIGAAESLGMIDLNTAAVVAVGLAVLPYMRAGAHILNVASQASFQPLPYLNVYAATKAFVRNYTRALHVELRDRGITATAVCPGWMQTDFFARGVIGAEKTARHYPHMADPAKVVAKALRDARRGRDLSVYGTYVKLCHLAASLLPQRVVMRVWLRQQKLR